MIRSIVISIVKAVMPHSDAIFESIRSFVKSVIICLLEVTRFTFHESLKRLGKWMHKQNQFQDSTVQIGKCSEYHCIR